MPQSIEDTLKALDSWYNEPTQGGDRPKLLSKLALLELCGWIEGRFDELIVEADQLTIKNPAWTEKNITEEVFGFEYKHLRGMLTKLVGETYARRIEIDLEATSPGDLDRFKTLLATLWKKRCTLAHADLVAHIASQTTFDAPSWSLNQHRILVKLIEKFRAATIKTLQNI